MSDNRSLGINESAVNLAAVFSELKPDKNIRLTPFVGYSSNRQIGITDNGNLYGIEGSLDNLAFSDLEINSEFRFRNEDIIPRRNLIRYYALSVDNIFERNISNSIKTSFHKIGRIFILKLILLLL